MLTRQAGFRPLTQVMGSCFYRTGWQSYPWGGGGLGFGGMSWGGGDGETIELEQQTEAWNEARRLALGRLAEEARLADADAVVGVRLRRRHRDWAAGVIEFVVVGTAVRSERFALEERPVLSNLSGQDFHKLVRHGFWPVGLVAGTTVAYVATGSRQQFSSTGLFTGRQNQEMPDFTRGIYDARALAMDRVSRQAHALNAHGVVGVTIERSQREMERDRGGGTNYTDLARRDARPRDGRRRGRARRGAARHLPRPPAERPDGAPVTQEPEPYDPTSTAGVPEHGVERLDADARPQLLHERPLGQRVPARQGRGLRAARARRRHVDLPHRLPGRGVEPEPGDGRPDAGDVPRPRARDDAHGGGGRPARRGRDRRGAPRRQPRASGARPRRVHRHRHRRAPRRGQAPPRPERPPVHERPVRPGLLHADSRPATGRSGS